MSQTKKKTLRDKKKIVRQTARWLEFFYDLIIFGALFGILYGLLNKRFIDPPLKGVAFFVHAGILFVLIFGARFALSVYRQVIRYGNPAAFMRLLIADIAAGGLFVLIDSFLPAGYNIHSQQAIAFVAADLIVCILARLLYYYFYTLAAKETPLGNFCNGLLRRVAMVDARSDEIAQVLSVREAMRREKLEVTDPINEIQRVALQFQLHGQIVEILQLNKGYINRTYRVRTFSEHKHTHWYTLQRINTNVFPDVDALMDNYLLVTEHLRETMLLPGHTEKGSVQSIKLTKTGAPYYRDDSGCWRMMTHFIDVYGMDIPDCPEVFYQAGRSFGAFIKHLSDVPPEKIRVVIPNFHNTASRYRDLEKAVSADPVARAEEVEKELKFIRARKHKYGLISDALESGEIPTRVCHNDCNLNNILFSRKTNLPVAIIDLDTVMPGSPLYDFGDSMRVGTNTARDDEKDLSKVSCDLALYESYARGFLEACGDLLTKEELELLPIACFIVTMEDGIRFLADHINGDVYCNIYYPGQNLDRARTQLALAEDMEKKMPQIRGILQKIYDELHLNADAGSRKF